MEAPRPGRTLIEHLDFALTVDTQDTVLRDASLVLEDDRIAAIDASGAIAERYRGQQFDEVIDGRRLGMAPGFVDSHVHLSETLSRGVFPDMLSTRAWVFHWAKPFYGHVRPDDERVSVQLGVAEMLRCGTTCFLDMGAQNETGVTARAAGELGMRGITGRHAADQKPEKIPPGWSDEMVEHHFFPNHEVALEVLEQEVRSWNGYANGRIRCWVNIEGKEPCSLELHLGAQELAERLNVGTTYHIASSIEEAHVAERRHNRWPIGRIADHGGLGPNLVLAHAVATQEEELELLGKHDTKVAFCPSTSFKLAKGAAKIGQYPEMMDRGVTVGLGTDGCAAAGNMNLMRQMYLVAGLFKDARLDPEMIGARKALRMATIDGARALGWDDEIGSLEAGKKADFVLFDLDHFEWTPFADPLQALVWSVSSASVAQTWVDGRCLYRDDSIAGLDETALRHEARGRAADIVRRAGLHAANVPVTTELYA